MTQAVMRSVKRSQSRRKVQPVSAVVGAGGIEVGKFRMSSFYGNAHETRAVVALLDCCE